MTIFCRILEKFKKIYKKGQTAGLFFKKLTFCHKDYILIFVNLYIMRKERVFVTLSVEVNLKNYERKEN